MRKTDKGLPRYLETEDVFVLSGAEDLVPVLTEQANGRWEREEPHERVVGGVTFRISRYRPKIEGLFARIERWTNTLDESDIFWRSISKDNVTTWYGRTRESRIFDPADPRRIFSWFLCQTHDDMGNVIVYEYKREDSAQLSDLALGGTASRMHERNRTSVSRAAQCYLKRIRYSHKSPYFPLLKDDAPWPEPEGPRAADGSSLWLFEVVLDYGEHDTNIPLPEGPGIWRARRDPFSSYRAGFEIRTYRRCERVLMFHHFADQPGVGQDCLVRSTDFTYSDEQDPSDVRNPAYTFLRKVHQAGYRRKGGGYDSRGAPPVEFGYSQPAVQDVVELVDSASTENLTAGADSVGSRWIDIHGEGVSGLLTERSDVWLYKPNLSPLAEPSEGHANVKARFGQVQTIASMPNSGRIGSVELMDLSGDARSDLVIFEGESPGLYESDGVEGWQPFRTFTSFPNLDFRDPNLRFIDLDGDGRADVLITEDDAFVWHPSLATEGFGDPMRIPQALSEENGPRIAFSDSSQSIYLADLSGDGLTDIVRVRNGEVCYWPNLGYGRFGAKITMDDAPWFDQPDQFDQGRVRLADIDGSGTTDIVYLHRDGVRLYFNQSGNGWSQSEHLRVFPRIDELASIEVLDILGNGTACLVWSSGQQRDSAQPIRYVNLMGSVKPHLLVWAINNLGGETSIEYAPSTKFYLADRRDGKPWATRLPFPVHVVEKITIRDHISRSRLVTRFAYHHGYFDGEEREFRGFGMVEQFDSESFAEYVVGMALVEGVEKLDPELFQPPTTTRNWYHTGALLHPSTLLHHYRKEYHGKAQRLPEPLFPAGLSASELRESLRALKGLLLRQEIYSFDGGAQQENPYAITENGFEVRCLQPRAGERHGVYFPVIRESISLDLERDTADPRITHNFALDLDPYGNPRKACSVVYGRQVQDATLPAEVAQSQQRQYITNAEVDYTADIDDSDNYRLRAPYESRGYELTGLTRGSALFRFEEIKAQIASAAPIAYEVIADGATLQKRLLSRSCLMFRDNELNALPLGQRTSLGLGFESYEMAFTPSVAAMCYGGKIGDSAFSSAGYVHVANDSNWWIPSGVELYPSNPRACFYIPNGVRDPLGLETVAAFDEYSLLIERVHLTGVEWNVVTAANDYRVLGPTLITDTNGNRSAVEHNELGAVVKSAIMGKVGSTDGDTLSDPTTRIEYELFNWVNHRQPNYTRSSAREQHGADNPRWQESYTYTNGMGDIVLVKTQTKPGKALSVNSDGAVVEVDAAPRWVGSGRVVLNNKRKPIKEYEPYFSATHEYEDDNTLRNIGVTPVLYYDSLGRNLRTLLPDGTFTATEFTPWVQKVFDANDTVKQSSWFSDRGSPDPNTEPEPSNNPERRAAWLAAKHAGTPSITHFDSLGRSVYAVSDYGGGKIGTVRSESDLTGRFTKAFDEGGREVASAFANMAGAPAYCEGAEKGRGWAFHNVLGATIKAWDEHEREFRIQYDAMHRPVETYVRKPDHAEILTNYVVYGDRLPNAQQLNLLGATHLMFDQAGVARVPYADFKGNPGSVERVLAKDYQGDLDWTALSSLEDVTSVWQVASSKLEGDEVFSASAQHDALNRPTQVTLPDGTVIVPTYDEANCLAALKAQIRGVGNFVDLLKGQDYDAKGQRQLAHYGNDVLIRYFYDPKTFRLTNLVTYRSDADPLNDALQKLTLVYDPTGNITQIRDDAQQTLYFNNAVVKPENLYEYDATYQLVRATGRELAAITNDSVRSHTDLDPVQLPHLNDVNAVRNYVEEYEYDLYGNIRTLKHRFQAQASNGWTRHYRYSVDDLPQSRTNRLVATSLPGDPDSGPYSATYQYDPYGNVTQMPHLAAMEWNFVNQLQRVDLGGGGKVYYRYGPAGQRLRKVIERNDNLKLEWIFLGALVIFRRRKRDTNALRFERSTLQLSDNAGLLARIDVKTRDDDQVDPSNPLNSPLIRYQHGNHLGSATLETDEAGSPVSYEEYHPYGTTAYRSSKSGFDSSLKRYRFSAKERDEETGLYYFGARYYAPWLGRWTSTDPAGFVDGFDLFRYCRNNPIGVRDSSGMRGDCATESFRYQVQHPDFNGSENPSIANFQAWGMDVDSRINSSNSRIYYQPNLKLDTERHRSVEVPGGTWTLDALILNNQTTQPHQEPSSSPAPRAASPHATVTSAATTHDSFRRVEYDREVKAQSRSAQSAVQEAQAEGSATRAWKAARSATNNRNQLRKTSQGDLTAAGQRISQFLEKDRTFNAMVEKYAERLPGVKTPSPTRSRFEVARRIAVASGQSRWWVKGAAVVGRVTGPLGLGLSVFALGNDLVHGDAWMGVGDALSLGGSAMVLAAATAVGTAGLLLGGIGLGITSGISSYRAYQSGDTVGGHLGVAGAVAGAAIAIGAGLVLAGAGAGILAVGVIGAAAVGLMQLVRWGGPALQGLL